LSTVPAGSDLIVAEKRLAGETLEAIAAALGMSTSGVHKALKRPHVAEWLAERQRDAAEAARLRIIASTEDVVNVIRDLATNSDGETPHAVRLAAADKLLTRAIGAPTQRSEISGPGGGPVQVRAVETMIAERLRAVTDAELGLPDDGEP
jgi:hypothetical protein